MVSRQRRMLLRVWCCLLAIVSLHIFARQSPLITPNTGKESAEYLGHTNTHVLRSPQSTWFIHSQNNIYNITNDMNMGITQNSIHKHSINDDYRNGNVDQNNRSTGYNTFSKSTQLLNTNYKHLNGVYTGLKSSTQPVSRTSHIPIRYQFVNYAHTPIPNQTFRFLLQPQRPCRPTTALLAAYIHSAPGHTTRRQLIRQTWGNEKLFSHHGLIVVFLVGETTNRSTELSLREEHEKYGDLLQANYSDTYRNLTLKALSGLTWLASCRQARYVLKADDDTFINMPAILSYLRAKHNHNSSDYTNAFMCNLWVNMPVKRIGKWAVSPSDYQANYFIPYCSGLAYIYSPEVATNLVRASRHVTRFWIDDVYITGILAAQLGMKHVAISTHYVEEFYFRHIVHTKFDRIDHYFFCHLANIMDNTKEVLTLWKDAVWLMENSPLPSPPFLATSDLPRSTPPTQQLPQHRYVT